MRITITIDTDNAAFEDWHNGEVARILRQLASEFVNSQDATSPLSELREGVTLRDVNGNTVGKCEIGEASESGEASADKSAQAADLAYCLTRLLQESPKPPKSIKHPYTFVYNLARSALSKWNAG